MHQMRAEVNPIAGTPPVWHVLRKDRSATLCGHLTPHPDPWCHVGGNTERYCWPCLTAYRQEIGTHS